ncbi:hypothetical protein BBOV_II005000 [Babesia bovis T2Bo]|uniref:hypothetical protein n=1 Tax=Babesia bovis T2Bo TaxID=484906 RepID=UPI001C36677D|nr:hypothetical protein BBOV_II005000 [Babesia bovis T2Bo]EDO06454.2 hypothetical protein BBOV_II005000 [Babesia bovis T2Bo]
MLILLYYGLFLVNISFHYFVSCHGSSRHSATLNTLGTLQIPRATGSYGLAWIWNKKRYPHLLAFHKEGCEFCEDMEPLIQQANQEFGLHIKRLDIASPSNYALLIKLDKVAHCGGLPFFYNLKTHRHICGATTYQNLVAWATGKPSGTIIPPPMKEEEIRATYRKTGVYARIMIKLKDLLLMGEKKMLDRLDNE